MTRLEPDAQLRHEILEELNWDALVDNSQVDVSVTAGVVTIVGTVPTYAHRLAAQEAAQAVAGVHDLVNQIDVKHSEDNHPSDDELQTMVGKVLAWDALVPDQDLAVAVADGRVTLTGTVAVDSQRREAERAIGHLAGVRGVGNEIVVREVDSGLDDVHTAIVNVLRRRGEHRAKRIDVTVDGSSVTLEGAAQSPLEKRAILGAVSHAPGIDMVCDELWIEPSGR